TRFSRDWSSDVCSSDLIGEREIERSSRPTHLPIDLTRRQVAFHAKALAIEQITYIERKCTFSFQHILSDRQIHAGHRLHSTLQRSEERRVGKVGRSRR